MKHRTEILVVDDEENIRFVLDKLLTDEGYAITTASSGEEALELYRKHSFPLLMVDIRLPGMNGLELLDKVKATNSDTQVVVMTSHAQFDYAAKALSSGAYEFLLKPFDNLELVTATISRAVEKIEIIEGNKTLIEQLQHDKTKLEDINKTLEDLTIRDGLTGLFNRRYINEYLETELARAHRHGKEFSVFMLELDGFEDYIEKYGQAQANELLRELSLILEKCKRNSDLAARYNEEDFLLVLLETSKDVSKKLAELVRCSVEDHKFSGSDVSTTVSIGVATYPNDASDSFNLIKVAEDVMGQAKFAGGNKVVLAGVN